MYYEQNEKSKKHLNIALAICTILAMISPGYSQTLQRVKNQSQEAQTYNNPAILQTKNEDHKTYSTGATVQKPKEVRKENKECDADCKVETLVEIGIKSNIANSIVAECKEGSIDPRHCIIVASAIFINESGGGKSNACKTRFNCFGIGSGKVKYTSIEESTANWVQKYNRYWYKAKDMSFFYSKSGIVSPSRYCTSEDSSGSSIGCPNGLRITSSIFNKLNNIF